MKKSYAALILTAIVCLSSVQGFSPSNVKTLVTSSAVASANVRYVPIAVARCVIDSMTSCLAVARNREKFAHVFIVFIYIYSTSILIMARPRFFFHVIPFAVQRVFLRLPPP